MVEYRLLTKDDGDAYFDVLHRSYETDRPYPLSFDAMDETREEAIQWLQEEPTFGLFVDHKLVSAISLRMPWGHHPGPFGVPHIGHFITDPDEAHQGNATKLLHYVEIEILTKLLHAPAVTLGQESSLACGDVPAPWLYGSGRKTACWEKACDRLFQKRTVRDHPSLQFSFCHKLSKSFGYNRENISARK